MFKTITNKNEYIKQCDVQDLPISYENKMEVELFGNKILLEKNPWLWHLHLKTTDACNASCNFCVEKNAAKKECPEIFLRNTSNMLCEMKRAGCLHSVSVTGGEPLMFRQFEQLCGVLKSHNINFLTINTNGNKLPEKLEFIDGLFDFIDISRHSVSDIENNSIFRTRTNSIEELKQIKRRMKHTKMRIQCVMDKVNTIENVLEFIEAFSFADDISFRKLMKLSKEYGVDYESKDEEYKKLLDYAYKNWELKEQAIQDYYVYEIWNNGFTDITLSYSNMKMLRKVEKTEPKEIFREFIIHPDGTISGSWKKDCKVIKEGGYPF